MSKYRIEHRIRATGTASTRRLLATVMLTGTLLVSGQLAPTAALGAPPIPTITATNPASPSNDTSPAITGVAGGIDLAVAHGYTLLTNAGNGVGVLLGGGTGSFTAPTNVSTGGGPAPAFLASADFNADGDPDLAVASPYSGLSILLGEAGTTFSAPTNTTFGCCIGSVAVADFNGDFDPDLAIGNDNGYVSILFGAEGGTFTGRTDYTVGGNMVSVGDFNADGDPELVLFSGYYYTGIQVSILFGAEGGTFTAPTLLGPSGMMRVVVGDFNGDSDPDLAFDQSGQVAILLGAEGGTFTGPTVIGAGYPKATGDFNADGDADLVVTNEQGSVVSILLGAEGATFTAGPSGFPFGPGNMSLVTVADLNGDADPDLAVSKVNSNGVAFSYVAVLLGSTGATFTYQNSFDAGNESHEIVAADFGDDIAEIKLYADDASCSEPAAASGSKAAFEVGGITIDVAADHTTELRARARDGEGNYSECSAAFSYTNDSTPPAPPTITAASPASPANDNTPEMRGDAEAGSAVTLYSNVGCSGPVVAQGTAGDFASPGLTVSVEDDSETSFTARATDAAGNNSGCSEPFAYTEDSTAPDAPTITGTEPASPSNNNTPAVAGAAGGGLDLAVANWVSGSVSILRGVGDGSFSAPTSVDAGNNPYALAVGEFNGDGDLDLAVANQGQVVILLGAAGSTFATPTPIYVGGDLKSISVSDFNGDGDPDLAIARGYTSVAILLGSAGGTFTGPTYPHPWMNAYALAVGEFNGDGDPDLAVGDYMGIVTILLGAENGTFAYGTSYVTGGPDWQSVSFAIGVEDFDADGDLDLAVNNYWNGSVWILLGVGDGTFTGPTSYAIGTEASGIAIEDFNGDSDPDLAIAVPGGFVSILLGAADATFTGPTNYEVGGQAQGIDVGDLNGDANPDLVVTNQSSGSISVLLGEVGGTFGASTNIIVGSEPMSVVAAHFDGSGTATVRVYKDDEACSEPAAASGTKAAFESSGITVDLDSDHTTQLRARALDDAGNVSACSEAFTYTEDSTPPTTPTITATSPDSPANDTTPQLRGTADIDSTISLYTGPNCSGPIAAQGSADEFTTPGLTATVANNSTTNFTARALDDAGNASGCSEAFTYTEDSTAPDAPTIAASSPVSPANDNEPELIGNTTDSSAVWIYAGVGCSGFPITTGSSFTFSSVGMTVTVDSDTTTTFTATTTDAAGNVSACSEAFTYTEDSTPPATPTITAGPTGVTSDSTPTFAFTSIEAGANAECRIDAATFATCASPLTTGVLTNGVHTFGVRTTDLAGNVGAAAARSFTVDTTAPATTITKAPGAKTTDRTPTFRFKSNEAGAKFMCAVDKSSFKWCKSPYTTRKLGYGKHTFRVRAVDLAGNVDRSPAARTFRITQRR